LVGESTILGFLPELDIETETGVNLSSFGTLFRIDE